MAEKAKSIIEPSRPGTGMIGRWTADMEPERINSLDDLRISVYRSLKATNRTLRLEQFVVELA
jgi:hypothetical protein